MKRFTAAIIGLGQIGQNYDYGNSDGSYILTHAHGFTYHAGFELIAAVDIDGAKRARFESKFKKPSFQSIDMMFQSFLPDIIAIAVPTEEHFKIFKEVIKFKPLSIICEKPIAKKIEDGKTMTEMAKVANCTLLVNYIRRFEPGVLSLKRMIHNDEIGQIYKGIVWYSKGILNNGSHFIDLLLFLLGKSSNIRIINKGRMWAGIDPEPDVVINFGNAEIFFLSGTEEYFSIGDMELIGVGGKIKYCNFGNQICIKKSEQDTVFSDYSILSKEDSVITNDMNRYQWHVLDHLYRHLTEKNPLNSNGQTAMETFKIINSIFRKGGYDV